jgi:hypothetical protein
VFLRAEFTNEKRAIEHRNIMDKVMVFSMSSSLFPRKTNTFAISVIALSSNLCLRRKTFSRILYLSVPSVFRFQIASELA